MAILLVFAFGVSAAGFDNQFRILLHGQKTLSDHWGVAGWGIVLDATNPNPRGLLLAGLLYKDESRWVEFMGGSFFDGSGEEPLLDFRFLEKSLKPFEGWLEIAYSPGSDKLLIGPSAVVATPISLFGAPVKVGGEADIFVQDRVISGGFGPRLVIPLPVQGWFVATSYQFKDEGEDILRTYLVLNF